MRPLDGVRVVELAHVAAGPFAGMLLADLGADVVKVEPPTGDQMRAWPPFADVDDGGERFSHNFASVNRNKRSVVADLKDPADLARVRELVAAADVVVENYRPGVLDRLGLGYDEVSDGHPGLVYASISGYGLTSPYVNDGAYDVVIQGMSGLMCGDRRRPTATRSRPACRSATSPPGSTPPTRSPRCCRRSRRTGSRCGSTCPMLDCLLGISALQTSEYWGSGREPQRLGTAHPRNAPYQGFAAADGDFTVAAGNDRLWAAVAEVRRAAAAGRTTRGSSPSPTGSRTSGELAALLQERFAGEKREHWLTELRARGVPCGPVNTFGEVLADPHVEQTGLVDRIAMPVAGEVPTVVFPVRIEGQSPRLDRGAPELGADPEVYAEWVAAHERRRRPRPGLDGHPRPARARQRALGRAGRGAARRARRGRRGAAPRRWCCAATRGTSPPASTSAASTSRPTRRWPTASCGSACCSSGCIAAPYVTVAVAEGAADRRRRRPGARLRPPARRTRGDAALPRLGVRRRARRAPPRASSGDALATGTPAELAHMLADRAHRAAAATTPTPSSPPWPARSPSPGCATGSRRTPTAP